MESLAERLWQHDEERGEEQPRHEMGSLAERLWQHDEEREDGAPRVAGGV